MTSSIFKGGLRISLFPSSSSDIFSFVGFLVCFFLKTVALEAEWRSSDEAVDGLPGDDGVTIDWAFKDEVSVGVGLKDVGGVTLSILKVGRPFAVKMEFRTVQRCPVPHSFWDKYADNCVRTQHFSKDGIDSIGRVMLSSPPFVLTAVIDEEKSGQDYCYMLTLTNMNEQDVNANGWPGRCSYIDGYLSSVLFLKVFFYTFFQKCQLIARVLWSLSSLQLIHFRLLKCIHCVYVLERHIVIIFYNPLTLGMTMWGDLRSGNIWSKWKCWQKFPCRYWVLGCERINNRSPFVNTCKAMSWLPNVTFIFFNYYPWKFPALQQNHFLLDFIFNIFFSLIKCLISTSLQYEWSFCFEIRRQNGFAPSCL